MQYERWKFAKAKIMWMLLFVTAAGCCVFALAQFDTGNLFPNIQNGTLPALVVNVTLESEDGSYVDSRQITVTISPDLIPFLTQTTPYPLPNALEDFPVATDWYWSWTTYTDWSPCSNDCGPGLQFAERFCVRVAGSTVIAASSTVDPCLDRDNVTTSVTQSSAGQPSQKRYRKCQVKPCHLTAGDQHGENEQSNNLTGLGYGGEDRRMDGAEDALRILCSKHDETVFSGDRKYAWVPFYLAHMPCAVLCRPTDEEFYVSFGEQVPDGSPCQSEESGLDTLSATLEGGSQPGICLNGTCQAVGCDGVTGSERRNDACGVCDGDSSTCQKIKIEFFERNLPAGSNKIGSIPAGACNISLTEQKPTGNVFALRTTGGYFLNGQWTASPTGDYGAAGTVFRYHHVTNGNSLRRHGERITARGPLTSDIEIILITKVANEGVVLEYSISSQRRQEPASRAGRRHRADHYEDYTSNQISYGPHRGDIPSIAEDFVDTPIQVDNSQPAAPEFSNEIPIATPEPRRERYRWSVAGYTSCSVTCGRGVKHSRLVCMMESTRQIVDDVYCEGVVKPASFQEACNERPCGARWHYGDWSACSVTCGTGTQTREARCKDQQGDGSLRDVGDEACGQQPSHGIQRACQNRPCQTYNFAWRSGEWSACDATCGTGTQRRQVKCYDQTYGSEVGDENCRGGKPAETQPCDGGTCRGTWLISEWNHCSNGCGSGQTSRHLVCFKDNRPQDSHYCDAYKRPETHQTCSSQKDCGGHWFEGPWSDCSSSCGAGTQQREVICISKLSYDRNALPTCETLPESECKYHPKPETRRQCENSPCHAGTWYTSPWNPCSHSCGVGVKTRQVVCLNHHKEASNDCPSNSKPAEMESCGTDLCPPMNDRTAAQSSANPSWIPTPDWANDPYRRGPVDLHNKAGTQYDSPQNDPYRRPVDLNNKAGTQYDAPQNDPYRGIDLSNKAGTQYDARPQQDYRPPIDLNNKAGTLYDAQPQQDYRPPIDLNNKAGTLYDSQPQQDYRPPVDLNNKAGTLYDAQPQQDYRPPIDLNNKAGTLDDAQPQQDYRPPVDLNNKAGTLYDSQPQQDYRPPVDLNNKAGTLYDAQPQQDYRPPIDLNNKAGTLYDSQPQQDYRPPVDLNNKAGTLYDSQPQQDYRPPVDLNNKAGTLYDAQPQQDYRPPVDLNNKAGTLYDSQPQQDYRPPIDLNNKAGTLYDAQPQQDYRPPVDLNNKAGTLYDAQPQQDYRPPVDLNNKAGTLYDAQPQQDYRPPVDLNNKAGTLYNDPPVDLNNKAPRYYDPPQRPPPVVVARKGDPGIRRTTTTTTTTQRPVESWGQPGRGDTPFYPPEAARSSQARRAANGMRNRTLGAGYVDIDSALTSRGGSRRATSKKPRQTGNGNGRSQNGCVDKIDRCRTVKELAFCRYDYYKKMCCKSCS